MTIKDFIAEQPAVLRRIFTEVPGQLTEICGRLAEDPPRRVLLVGSGTSRNAALSVAPVFRAATGWPVEVTGPRTLVATLRQAEPNGCAVVLSQSGGNEMAIAALRHAQGCGLRTLAITANAESPLAQESGPCAIMDVGAEPVGPKTKGYTASVATLLVLAWVLHKGGISPESIAEAGNRHADRMSAALPDWQAAGEEMADTLRDVRFLLLMGEGRHLGTAMEGAHLVAQMTGVPTAACETEESLHGRFHVLAADAAACFLAADEEQSSLARNAARVLIEMGIPVRVLFTHPAAAAGAPVPGAEVAAYASGDLVPEALDLLNGIVPLQYFAEALALARGLDPEQTIYPDLARRLGIKVPGA